MNMQSNQNIPSNSLTTGQVQFSRTISRLVDQVHIQTRSIALRIQTDEHQAEEWQNETATLLE
jgi:hypothetical protein